MLDVTNRDDMTRVIDDVTGEVGDRGLQALVNNAGVGVGGPVEYVTEEDWRWVFDVNLFAVVALTSAAIPMLRTGHGRIVHIGSIGGRISSPGPRPVQRVEARDRSARRVAAARVQALRHADPRRAHRTGRGEDGDLGQGRHLHRGDRARARRRGPQALPVAARPGARLHRRGPGEGRAGFEGRRRRGARAHVTQAEGPLPRGPRRQAERPRGLAPSRPAPRRGSCA